MAICAMITLVVLALVHAMVRRHQASTEALATLDSLTGYRTELQSAVDGNTVNMDVERAAFAENALHYEASVTFINGMLRSMNSAITGQ